MEHVDEMLKKPSVVGFDHSRYYTKEDIIETPTINEINEALKKLKKIKSGVAGSC